MTIVRAESADQIAEVRRLFEEYWNEFGFTPCFQNFAAELAGLPGAYSPPDGRLALAAIEEAPAGCVALRRFDAARCEFKRLYVRPAFRARHVGRALLDWVIAEARSLGYREMLADTLPVMAKALEMYDRAGFERISPYGAKSTPDTVYLRLAL
ncbi:MAG TPA: GNAT family N-acetyltransferase [Bryobacteraceae bacterium]|jgi:carbonic anhydrase